MALSGSHESSDKPIMGNSKKSNERELSTIPSEQTVYGRSRHGDSRKGNKSEEREDSKNSFDLKNPMDIPSEKPPSSPRSTSSSKNGTSDSFVVGQEVHLLSPVEIRVARGRVTAVCPTNRVGGTKLGKNFVGVCVEEIFVPDEDLTRPYADYGTIGEAEGATIAWQRTCLQLI